MPRYHIAGREIDFSCPVPEMRSFARVAGPQLPKTSVSFPPSLAKSDPPAPLQLSTQTVGWVGETHCRVETWMTPTGRLLKVDGGRDVHIAANGRQITSLAEHPTDLDREILAGPALVLALALQEIWCLHASAVQNGERVLLILGESGQGKSTLAAYLASTFPRVADDILPVTISKTGLTTWPHFPQLKLPPDDQPGAALPESLPAGGMCILVDTEPASQPDLKRASPSQAAQALLRHTAGTRLLEPKLLSLHLAFCSQAAMQLPAYQLTYPHRRDALPLVKELLQTI